MMNVESTNRDLWDACPPGELRRMVDRIKTRQRREALKQIGSVAVAMGVAGAGGYFAALWLRGPAEYHYGGIACREVRRLLPDYCAHQLDAALAQKITVHLEKCPNCGAMYRRMIAGPGTATGVLDHRNVHGSGRRRRTAVG